MTLFALEKAKRLVGERMRTLLIRFNRPWLTTCVRAPAISTS